MTELSDRNQQNRLPVRLLDLPSVGVSCGLLCPLGSVGRPDHPPIGPGQHPTDLCVEQGTFFPHFESAESISDLGMPQFWVFRHGSGVNSCTPGPNWMKPKPCPQPTNCSQHPTDPQPAPSQLVRRVEWSWLTLFGAWFPVPHSTWGKVMGLGRVCSPTSCERLTVAKNF